MNNFFDNPAAFAPFFGDAIQVAYSGARREDGQMRRISAPIDAHVQRGSKNGVSGESVAMGSGRTWEVSFPFDRWPEASEPQVGDVVEFSDPQGEWKTVRLKVAAVSDDCGWWTLKARSERSA